MEGQNARESSQGEEVFEVWVSAASSEEMERPSLSEGLEAMARANRTSELLVGRSPH
jgi:hypothetical protein